MSVISKAQLKDDFLDGKVITEPNMADLIDSCYNSTNQLLSFDRTFVKSEILAFGAAPIELLPQPGDNKFYDVIEATWVYKFVGDTYLPSGSPVPDLIYLSYGTTGDDIDAWVSTNGWGESDDELFWNKMGAPQITKVDLNQSLVITTRTGQNITANSLNTDGTIRLSFDYYIKNINSSWPPD